jgi:hypothetical protein
MANNKVSLVVMVAYLNAPLAFQNILEVPLDLNYLFLDLVVN